MDPWQNSKSYYDYRNYWNGYSSRNKFHGGAANGPSLGYFQNRAFEHPDIEERRRPQKKDVQTKEKNSIFSDRVVMRKTRDRSAVNPLVKHFLFTVNVLFFVAGVAITSLSVYVLVDTQETIGCFLDFIFNSACLLCLLGCLMLIPAFLGCYGALRENTCIIKMYFILAIVLLLIEIVLIVFFFTFTLVPGVLSNIGIYPSGFLEDSIEGYRFSVHTQDGDCGRDRDGYVDFIQEKFSCCGSSDDDEGYLDWNSNPYYQCNSSSPEACSVPFSCCREDPTGNINYMCGADKMNPANTDLSTIYVRGCEKGMREVFGDNIVLIGCFSIGGVFLQMFFTSLAIRLNSQVHRQRSKW